MTHSNIETLALLDEERKGTNWYLLRTRWAPIRTLSLLPMKIKITMNENIPLYQQLAPKIRELKALGMTNREITGAIQHCSIKNFIQAFSSPKFFHHPFARIGSYCKSIKIFNWNSRESHPEITERLNISRKTVQNGIIKCSSIKKSF